jgi:hypothetical protein
VVVAQAKTVLGCSAAVVRAYLSISSNIRCSEGKARVLNLALYNMRDTS